jgi:hypothetical protein
MRRFSVGVGGLLHLAVLAQVETRTLDQGWEFRMKGTGNWFAADVPGVIHTDLIRHGLIPDPYVAFNADSVKWVHERNWTYRTAFHLSSADLEAKDIDLVFEGVGYLRGHRRQWQLGDADGQYVPKLGNRNEASAANGYQYRGGHLSRPRCGGPKGQGPIWSGLTS